MLGYDMRQRAPVGKELDSCMVIIIIIIIKYHHVWNGHTVAQ